MANGSKPPLLLFVIERLVISVTVSDHNKLSEAWQAKYTNGTLNATFLAMWDLNRVLNR
jgi:hypothetical protein